MIELNHILLFIACVSPVALLLQSWRRGVDAGWRKPAIAVLSVTAIAWLFARELAGYIGGGAWFFLLFLPAVGTRNAIELAQRGHFTAARAILAALRLVHPRRAVREHAHLVATIEAAHRGGRAIFLPTRRGGFFGREHPGLTPFVAAIIVVNILFFTAESLLGGSTNFATLHLLGALEPFPLLGGDEYWRLLTALFLHYGALHLFMNCFALYFLGPTLEKAIGAAHFAVCYLVSGIASSSEVALLWQLRWLQADQLVGASGAVMGIVGAWAGSLVRQRHLPRSRAILRNIALIVIIQTLFDLLTPQVSMAAHLGGLASGFVLGLLLAPRELRV